MQGTPVTYTSAGTKVVEHVAHVTAKEAVELLELIESFDARRVEYGDRLLQTVEKSKKNGHIELAGRGSGGLVLKSYRLRVPVAMLLGACMLDPRPIDSLLASLRRIAMGTAYPAELPYLAFDGISRKQGDLNVGAV